MDCKATVNIGEYARGGKTRGDNRALDHDMGCTEKYIPFGIVDEDSGQLFITFGSSYKTSDFIVDSLKKCWDSLPDEKKAKTEILQFKVDNGPESSGVRRQFLKRMVAMADEIKKPIQLLYYPPQQVQSYREMLGSFRATLEWSKTCGCQNYADVVKQYDMERFTSIGYPQ